MYRDLELIINKMIFEVEVSKKPIFFIGKWKVEPSLGRISCGQDSVKLEPKVMEVLLCLVQAAGEVLSREQLESLVWKDRIVSYDSVATTIIKLRKAFNDDSRNPEIIETIPKRGYRLIAEATAVPGTRLPAEQSVQENTVATSPVTSEEQDTARDKESEQAVLKKYKTGFMVAFAVAVFMSVLSVVLLVNDNGNSTEDSLARKNKIAVAVLPFKNISNDPQQDYFSDGITADLITDLSRISALYVIARNSAFNYRNDNIDVRMAGKELGVQYIVEGSVRKERDTVRISARLVDTRNGYNLWAQRFDGKLGDVFQLQDDVTGKIIKSLKIKLNEAERTNLIHTYTKSIEAYDHFLQGWSYFWNMSRDGNRIARDSYLKAIEIDERFARAYANLALTYAYEYLNGWSESPAETIEKANEYALKAVEIDSNISQVYWALGVAQSYNRDYKSALATSKKALELDPNYADGYGLLATVLNYAGKPKQALEAMAQAMQLNPRYPSIYRYMRGEMYFNAQNYQEAIEDFETALEINPEAQEPRVWLSAAYAYSGNIEEASWQVDQLTGLDPKLSLESFEKVIPLNDPAQKKHLIDGLYMAGLR